MTSVARCELVSATLFIALTAAAACGGRANPQSPSNVSAPRVKSASPRPPATTSTRTAPAPAPLRALRPWVQMPTPSPARYASPGTPVMSASSGGMLLPTHGARDVPSAALEATVDSRDSCIWLVDRTLRRIAALWPQGYRAKFAPLRVLDAHGRVVWRQGKWREIGGGFSPVHVDRTPPECRTGDDAWWVAPLS